ncbi:uncharacterized protein [Rutidosis leptorrhynchoides]|uniref:uncharacterized protein n=1 Tax=Rutidosis leptorrhynchoides TaxID=125765 RepID=UPI003A9988E3
MCNCGVNFNDSFVRIIGDGRKTLFWEDHWTRDKRFRNKYPRIYRLEEVKDVSVGDRVSWVNSVPIVTWQWCRTPSGRCEDELNSMMRDISGAAHKDEAEDTKRRRLPVRVELDNRGIDLHTVRCPICDDDMESTDHALVLCKLAFEVWERVYRWWGFGNFSSTSVIDLFNGEYSDGNGSKKNPLWQAVEWACGYYIWKNRNKKVFHNKVSPSSTILNDI